MTDEVLDQLTVTTLGQVLNQQQETYDNNDKKRDLVANANTNTNVLDIERIDEVSQEQEQEQEQEQNQTDSPRIP